MVMIPISMIVMRMGMGMDGGMFVHSEFGRRDTGLQDAIDRDLPAVDGEAAKRALQFVERQTGIEQRAEDHVPRRAGEAVEVEHLHSKPSALKLKNFPPPRMM